MAHPLSPRVLFAIVLFAASVTPAAAQTEYPQSQGWSNVNPPVVWCGDPESTITIEFHVVGRTDVAGVQVTNQAENRRITLFDDGTHGDAAAGDNLFTAAGVQPWCISFANTSPGASTVRVTILFDDGTPTAVRTFTVAANSRFNVNVSEHFPSAMFKRFGALVESLDGRQIMVERALYSNAGGVTWAAGSNALATRLTP